MTISRKLHTIGKPILQIVHEMESVAGIALSDVPARHKLCVRVERNICPTVATAFGSLLNRAILSFGKYEAPNFVTLDARAFQIAKNLVLIFRAGAAKITEKFHYGRAMYARHSRDRAKRIALDQSGNHRFPFFGAQFVHVSNMLDRSSIVKQKDYSFLNPNLRRNEGLDGGRRQDFS